jgi:SAM-dependent methyltransferase
MWLRRLLADLCGASEASADTPAGFAWDDLPDRCVLQLHWRPDARLVGLLDAHGFAPVVLARHPFDVLVSILQFAQHDGRTARWLNGEAGNELPLVGADPCGQAFRAYALSARARALLSVTPTWWSTPELRARVLYEDLVADPEAELTRLAAELELEQRRSSAGAVEANRLERLRAATGNGHFWQGRPGLWRSLLLPDLVRTLANAHRDALDPFGYDASPDDELDATAALDLWSALDLRPTGPPGSDLAPRVATHAEVLDCAPAELADRLYRLVLRRPPDAAGLQRAIDGLGDGTLSPAGLLEELVRSPEARRVRSFDDALGFSRWARGAGERPRAIRAPAGSEETFVAVPWALSRYRGQTDVLDVGTAYTEPAYAAALVSAGAGRVVGVDLAPFTLPGIEAVVADVRSLPFERRTFDVVFCLATLHHVGHDNRPYGLGPDRDAGGPRRALRELRRVLRSDGSLFVSVPTGARQDLGLFEQRPPSDWIALFEQAGFFVVEHEVYELDGEGWLSVDDAGPLLYGERGPAASAVLCAELRPGRIRQSARRLAAAALAAALR